MLNDACFSTGNNEYSTPPDFFAKLNELFNFTLDPCCTHESALCKKHYTKAEDGLTQDWEGETVFANIPYSRDVAPNWVQKCCAEGKKKNTTVVLLLPSRTDSDNFQKIIFPNYRAMIYIDKRLKFGGMKTAAPFPSVIVIFQRYPLGFMQELKLSELGHLEKR